MNRKTWIIIIVVVVLAVAGWAIWAMGQRTEQAVDQQGNTNTNTQSTNNSQTSNATETNSVTIKDFAFSPATIKVKKGTTVTWTNQDTTGHNVVAEDSNNTGGLPLSAPLLNKGETFSFTFNDVGTFKYHCAPHATMMKGTVEVTE